MLLCFVYKLLFLLYFVAFLLFFMSALSGTASNAMGGWGTGLVDALEQSVDGLAISAVGL
jgi:hypothetical protein